MSPQRPDSTFKKPTTSWLGVAGLFVLLLMVGGGAWWFYKTEPITSAPPPVPLARTSPAPDGGDAEDAGDEAENTAGQPLPAVDQSDAFVREQATSVSADPRVALWLKTPGLLRRMVAGVADLADADTPRGTLSFLAPQGEFPVVEQGGKTYASPRGYARYDKLGLAVASVDARAAVETLKRVEPLCNRVWQEIATDNTTFRGSLRTALARLASANVDGMDQPLVPHGALWAYEDPVRENRRSSLEKQLMRMGPENAERVKAKAHELEVLLTPAAQDAGAAAAVSPGPAASPPTSAIPPAENASP